MRFFRAALLAFLLAPAVNRAAEAAVETAPPSPPAETRPDLDRRLARVRDDVRRLADLRFGVASPAARTLEITDQQLIGRLEIAADARPAFLTVVARPLDRDSSAYRERQIERLTPSAPTSTRGLRVDRLPAIQGEAYGLQTSQTYHVLILFADYLVEIGGPATEEDERQIIRDFAQPLVISLLEAADLPHVRSIDESARSAFARARAFERLRPDDSTENNLIFAGRHELTDERLLTLAETWFTAQDNARLRDALRVFFDSNTMHARHAESGTESLDRDISAIRDSLRTTLRIQVTRLAKAERAQFENPDPRRRRDLLGASAFPVAVFPGKSIAMPDSRGFYHRWPNFAQQLAYRDGYLVQIALSATSPDDPVLAPEFLDAEMARLLGELELTPISTPNPPPAEPR